MTEWISRVTYIHESCHIWMDRTHGWVTSHIRMSHVTHMNCSHIWMSHTYMDESCYAYEQVMSHIWIVTSHAWMSHTTQTKDLHHFLFQISVHGSALRHVHRVHRQVMQAEHLNNVYVCMSVWVCLCVFINISICTRIYMHTYLYAHV